MIAVANQAVDFIRGADISLVRPQQVLIFFDRYPDGNSYVIVAAQMSYVNVGAPNYAGVVEREFVELLWKGSIYRQFARSYERIDRAGDALDFHRISDAQPVTVPGASTISHPTVFGPQPAECAGNAGCEPDANFLTHDAFLRQLAPDSNIRFAFGANVLRSNKTLNASCSVDLSINAIVLLAQNKWYSAICR